MKSYEDQIKELKEMLRDSMASAEEFKFAMANEMHRYRRQMEEEIYRRDQERRMIEERQRQTYGRGIGYPAYGQIFPLREGISPEDFKLDWEALDPYVKPKAPSPPPAPKPPKAIPAMLKFLESLE